MFSWLQGYYKKSSMTSGLICKLYLNKDKSKNIEIQLYSHTTCQDLLKIFKQPLQENLPKIDHQTQEYKFVLKDITNKYNQFTLNDDFLLYNSLMDDKFELYYIPFNIRKADTIFTMKEKNIYKSVEENLNENNNTKINYKFIIKQNNVYKYSKKKKEFLGATMRLDNDVIEITKKYSSKKTVIIPLSSISKVQQSNEHKYRQLYNTLKISSENKNYFISIEAEEFESWLYQLNKQIHCVVDSFSFTKYCEDFSSLNKKKSSTLVQLFNKFTNIKGILSINVSKKIFYDYYTDNAAKELYDLIVIYKKIFDTGEYSKILNILEKIMEFFQNEEFSDFKKKMMEFQKNDIEITEKIKKYIEDVKNLGDNFKKEDLHQIVGINTFNNVENYLIKECFEPHFNKIISSNEKENFYGKIMDNILNIQNKEDNIFYDLESSINELISVDKNLI